ncbi:hypothetical protein SAMN05421837_101557 [Amycolatopsis pretoriensis]|uniref:Uncharacterized protein n=1 Tax=Amycolatopsis pretoriensis TaxID=218821 RepID=A0A1H5Q409_9PSEU|nr:hypothetical protein [Amycolatopsis pretoriensis]SEF20816.1 hypothetical protein SAMN05421837_101557 [Amycolatopsis pretoriensis]
MATNDRPARLALTAAVLALLLGGAGVLVQHRFSATASPGGTVAGIEAAGSRVSVRPAPEPAVATPLTRRFGGGADLAFDGAQPVRVRIPVPAAPPAGFAPVVIGGRTLVPAVYDAASRSIVAELGRPGPFWGGLLDFAALGREVRPAPVSRPGCAGRSAGSDGVVVASASPARRHRRPLRERRRWASERHLDVERPGAVPDHSAAGLAGTGRPDGHRRPTGRSAAEP